MAKLTGFLEYRRELPPVKEVNDRIKNYKELHLKYAPEMLKQQAARCMDCGVPFCHHGCPIGNVIPEFNEAVYYGNWKAAYQILVSTNNFPEFTGRICPAPCEASCVLGLENAPTTIEAIEKHIIEKAFELGLVKPELPKSRTGKRVAVIGSGPAGLAAAVQLNKAGHWVVVFERSDRIGGLLRYGIPDFKLDKQIIDRRLNIMREEGISFKTNANVGINFSIEYLNEHFDAIVLCTGSTVPRDLLISGRNLKGIHFAMDFLTQQNKSIAGEKIAEKESISAFGKHVVVIGGGDTGSDCVGTSIRQGAASVTQIELLPKPPLQRVPSNPWPQWPNILRSSSSHDEGGSRFWSILTKEFAEDENGNVKTLKIADIEWNNAPGVKPSFREIAGTEREIACDLALLAIGFVHTEHQGLLKQLNIDIDDRGNIKTKKYQTNIENIFAAGDARRGQSLVVWAISEGREAAFEADRYLSGRSFLQNKDRSLMNLLSYI
jgi:glutamate synthase (NADPH/NADH) small chain